MSCASGTAPDDAGCGDRQVRTKHTAGLLKSPCPCSLLCAPMLGHVLHLGTGWAMQQGWAGRTKSYHTHQTHLRRHQGWDVNRLVCKCDLLSPLSPALPHPRQLGSQQATAGQKTTASAREQSCEAEGPDHCCSEGCPWEFM